MSNDNLTDKLIGMTNEIRDLKTAHKRGLGTTRFYKYELETYVDQGQFYQFVARTDPDEPKNAIIIPEIHLPEPVSGVSLTFDSIGSTSVWMTVFSGWQIPNHTKLKATVISSSKISEFTLA